MTPRERGANLSAFDVTATGTMGELLACPVDQTPLVMMADEGIAQTHCHRCSRQFRFVRGILRSVRMSEAGAQHLRTVKLSIAVEGETDIIESTMLGSRWGTVYEDTPITAVEQFDRYGARELVAVSSRGAATFHPHEPGDTASIRTVGGAVQGGIVTVVAVALLMYFYHWAFLFAALPLAAIVTGLSVWRWRKTSTKHRLDSARMRQLEREQWLLEQLERYRLQSTSVDERITRYRKQIAELRALLSEMESASGDYEHRASVVRRGLEALRHHQANDEKLRDAIARTIETVEIEYKASRALDHLPEDAIERLSTTIAELDAIEAENAVLEAQLEANAEVNAIAPG